MFGRHRVLWFTRRALEIEKLGEELGFTIANGRYRSISMGQGQEANAENALKEYS